MCVATVKLRLASSGSESRWLVDPSLLALEGASWRRSASVSAVLPAPSWAMIATLRMRFGSSMGFLRTRKAPARWASEAQTATDRGYTTLPVDSCKERPMRTAPPWSQTRLAAVLLVFSIGAARAQQIARPLTAGVEPPVRSLLLDDDATAVSGNPGSLAFAGKLQLDFVHETGTGGAALSGNGMYLAGGLPHLVLGTAFEWTRPGETCSAASPCGRRFSLGAGVKAGQLGLGATYHSYSSRESTDLDRLTSWDLGAVLRPARSLALGFAALDVNAPFFAGPRLPRRYAASFGIRPFEELLSLTADAYASECSGTPALFAAPGPRACGAGSPDLRFSADLAVVPGLHVLGQL